jgi:hypothetical protein
VFALGWDRRFKIFVGPAITLGEPNLDGTRAYEASGGILATAGIEYTPFRFRVAGLDLGLTGELVYNHYIAGARTVPDAAKDAAATIRAGIGLSLRWGI